jgi:hypothetical protein
MFKLHFLKGSKGMHKSYIWFQKKITIKTCPMVYESTCSLDELDEKLNYTKISKSWNFEKKGARKKANFFNHLTKQLCSMGPKCLALGGGHMCKK